MRGTEIHINTETQDGKYIVQHTEWSVRVQTKVKHENKAVSGTLLICSMYVIKILKHGTWLCGLWFIGLFFIEGHTIQLTSWRIWSCFTEAVVFRGKALLSFLLTWTSRKKVSLNISTTFYLQVKNRCHELCAQSDLRKMVRVLRLYLENLT
jgi:hypothetical protein